MPESIAKRFVSAVKNNETNLILHMLKQDIASLKFDKLEDDKTVLYMAVLHKNSAVVSELLKITIDVNSYYPPKMPNSALDLALSYENEHEIVLSFFQTRSVERAKILQKTLEQKNYARLNYLLRNTDSAYQLLVDFLLKTDPSTLNLAEILNILVPYAVETHRAGELIIKLSQLKVDKKIILDAYITLLAGKFDDIKAFILSIQDNVWSDKPYNWEDFAKEAFLYNKEVLQSLENVNSRILFYEVIYRVSRSMEKSQIDDLISLLPHSHFYPLIFISIYKIKPNVELISAIMHSLQSAETLDSDNLLTCLQLLRRAADNKSWDLFAALLNLIEAKKTNIKAQEPDANLLALKASQLFTLLLADKKPEFDAKMLDLGADVVVDSKDSKTWPLSICIQEQYADLITRLLTYSKVQIVDFENENIAAMPLNMAYTQGSLADFAPILTKTFREYNELLLQEGCDTNKLNTIMLSHITFILKKAIESKELELCTKLLDFLYVHINYYNPELVELKNQLIKNSLTEMAKNPAFDSITLKYIRKFNFQETYPLLKEIVKRDTVWDHELEVFLRNIDTSVYTKSLLFNLMFQAIYKNKPKVANLLSRLLLSKLYISDREFLLILREFIRWLHVDFDAGLCNEHLRLYRQYYTQTAALPLKIFIKTLPVLLTIIANTHDDLAKHDLHLAEALKAIQNHANTILLREESVQEESSTNHPAKYADYQFVMGDPNKDMIKGELAFLLTKLVYYKEKAKDSAVSFSLGSLYTLLVSLANEHYKEKAIVDAFYAWLKAPSIIPQKSNLQLVKEASGTRFWGAMYKADSVINFVTAVPYMIRQAFPEDKSAISSKVITIS